MMKNKKNPIKNNAYADFDDAKDVKDQEISADTQQKTRLDPKVYKRRKFAALSFVLVFLLAISLGTTFLLNRSILNDKPAASVPADVPVVPSGLIDDADWNFIGPVERTINQTELIAPDYRMISLPTNGVVDTSYFNTVTFIGDSVSQGLAFPSYITGITGTSATICAYKGASPKSIYDNSKQTTPSGEKVVPMEEIVASAPDNVYILFGANAMIMYPNDDDFIAQYAEMLVQLRANLHPDVAYYIQTITPVTLENDRSFDNARIQGLNDRLAKLAYESGVYFIDLYEVLADENGVLLDEFAGSDGLHLTPEAYAAWIDYLITHTAYHPRNQYLPGSVYGEPL